MGERTSYPPGTFSWAELATSDADAAKAFYANVFGWEYRDAPIPDGSVYSTATRDGKNVAALFASDQPPHWNCYVTVESADATAARAGERGATILAEPFDVMDVGRTPVSLDRPIGEGDDCSFGEFVEDAHTDNPLKLANNSLLREKIDDLLKTLTFREREIIRLRYGLTDGYCYTLEEVGRIFKVTRERVRKIEAKAVAKLQHPVRARKLEGFLPGSVAR